MKVIISDQNYGSVLDDCNRIFLAYHPNMDGTGPFQTSPDFTFRAASGSSGRKSIRRADFLDEVYNPLIQTFAEQSTTVIDIGKLSQSLKLPWSKITIIETFQAKILFFNFFKPNFQIKSLYFCFCGKLF